MDYCLYNSIKTPDGTVLHCKNSHDYQSHYDKVTGETYMIDGLGYGTRSSINIVEPQDLRVWTSSAFEVVRVTKFWASFGRDGTDEKKMMSLEEMEKSHIEAILRSQTQIKGTEIEKIFLKELVYRIEVLRQELDEEIAPNKIKIKKLRL